MRLSAPIASTAGIVIAVASSAPTLNKIQDQVQSSLEANGLSKNVAEGLSSFVTTAAAFGIGNTIGGN